MRKELDACLTNTVLTLLQLISETKYRTAYECLVSVRRAQARFLFRDSIGRWVWYAVVLHDGRRWTVDGPSTTVACRMTKAAHSTRAYSGWTRPSSRHRTAGPVEHGDGACGTGIGDDGDSASWAERRRGCGQQSVLSTPRAGRRSITCSRTVLCLPCPEARMSAETLREVCAYAERIVVVMTDTWSKLGPAFYTLPSPRPVSAGLVGEHGRPLCPKACARKCCSHALCLILDCVCVSSTRSLYTGSRQITARSGHAHCRRHAAQCKDPSFSFSFSVEAYIPGSRTYGRTDARI